MRTVRAPDRGAEMLRSVPGGYTEGDIRALGGLSEEGNSVPASGLGGLYQLAGSDHAGDQTESDNGRRASVLAAETGLAGRRGPGDVTEHLKSLKDSNREFRRILKRLGWSDVDKDLPPVYYRLVKDGELRENQYRGTVGEDEEAARGSAQAREAQAENAGFVVDDPDGDTVPQSEALKASEESGAFDLPNSARLLLISIRG